MNEPYLLRRRLLAWSLVFGIWTLIGLFDAAQVYLWGQMANKPTSWWCALVIGVVDWYVLAALTPLVYLLARRFRFERGQRTRDVLLHVIASGLCALVVLGVSVPVVDAVPCQLKQPIELPEMFQRYFFSKFQLYVLVYWVVVGITHALGYYQKYRERELQAAELRARLAQSQLQVLKMQLHPHFLFNTLHAISALMHQDVEVADRMIARLGELLRSALESGGTQEVPLRQELEFIKPYLEIEQARLGPRLTVQLEVTPEALEAQVPNLLLQPLVENAIRHGIAPRNAPGRIAIRARRERDCLRLQVSDNGIGLSSNYQEGVGVANTRARLQQLYGEAQRFEMGRGPDGGLVVTVAVPFHTAPANGAAHDVKGGHGADPDPDRR
jgi:two-component system, LytTR family, sensor kinase